MTGFSSSTGSDDHKETGSVFVLAAVGLMAVVWPARRWLLGPEHKTVQGIATARGVGPSVHERSGRMRRMLAAAGPTAADTIRTAHLDRPVTANVSSASPRLLAPPVAQGRFWKLRPLPVVATLLGLALWSSTLHTADPARLSGLGLISALSPWYFFAVALLTVGFVWSLMLPRPSTAVLIFQVTSFVFVLHGTVSIIEPVPRFATAWLHVGFTEYIARTGRLLPGLDARFNWPGFFTLAAFLVRTMGVRSAVSFVRWSPVVFNAAYLAPLWVISGSFTTNRRIRWASLWAFAVANWIGQDYFSPQAISFFYYLVVIAILLRFFPRLEAGATMKDLLKQDQPNQRMALVSFVAAIFAIMVITHQLTPFALIASVAALAFVGRRPLRSMTILMIVVAASWLSYGAVAFWSGHLKDVFGAIGRLEQTLQENLGGRLQGNGVHIVAQYLRLGIPLIWFAMASVGVLRRRRRGQAEWTLVLLALVPFVILGLQSYGGEAIFRAYLLSIPFLAILAAMALFPSGRAHPPIKVYAVGLAAALALTVGFVIARYGNEQFESFTQGEVMAVQQLYQMAPPGARLIAITPDLPWRYRDIESYDYVTGAQVPNLTSPDVVLGVMSRARTGYAFLILTRAQDFSGELNSGLASGWTGALQRKLIASGKVTVAYSDSDAVILRYVRNTG